MVLILGILACVAVPRLNLGAVSGARTDAVVRRIATDLRRARAQAILEAAANSAGYAVVMSGAEPYSGYQIVSLEDSSVVADCEIPADVQCDGGRRFEFGPLGNLKAGSDTQLNISTEGRTYLVEIVSATGTVTWTRESE